MYFAAQRVYRSDDRGDSWRPVSPDLSRQIDRNALKLMGRTWSVDAVERNVSTTLFGTIFTLAESPLKEGLLFAGTDDGLVQISEDSGAPLAGGGPFPRSPRHHVRVARGAVTA